MDITGNCDAKIKNCKKLVEHQDAEKLAVKIYTVVQFVTPKNGLWKDMVLASRLSHKRDTLVIMEADGIATIYCKIYQYIATAEKLNKNDSQLRIVIGTRSITLGSISPRDFYHILELIEMDGNIIENDSQLRMGIGILP